MPRVILGLAVALVTACGPLSPPSKDAGAGGGLGGGTGGGGGVDSGVGGGSGGGAGGGLGGGTGGGNDGGTGGGGGGDEDGGMGGGGGVADFGFTFGTASFMGGSGSTTADVVALQPAGTAVWALLDNGELYRSVAGPFEYLMDFPDAVDLFVAQNSVVVVTSRSLRRCPGNFNCTTQSSYDTFDLITPNNDFAAAACGTAANDVWVVGETGGGDGVLYHFDGAQWTAVNRNLPLRHPKDCWFDGAGELLIAGERGVVRSLQGVATFAEVTPAPVQFRAGATVGADTWVVGDNFYIARRTGPLAWTVAQSPSGLIASLWAVGGPAAGEVFALAPGGYRWNGATWSAAPQPLPGFPLGSAVRAILATGPDEVYVAGGNDSGPVILRGAR